MKTQIKPFIIFSVEGSHLNDYTNEDNTAMMIGYMDQNNIKYKQAQGHYKGTKETSFIVDASQIDMVKAACKQFNQECYLMVHNDTSSELVFQDESSIQLGTFKAVTRHTATQNDAYTLINDKYFIAD